MSSQVYEAICQLFDQQGVSYRQVQHEPAHTCEESARLRNEPQSIGGKSLLLKIEDDFRLLVMSAALQLDSRAVKRHFNTKRTRFATTEELHELTGLVSGAVPPLGAPILPFELYVDESIVGNDRIAFNAGRLTHSIILNVDDYLKVACPTAVLRLSRSHRAD